MAVVTEDAELLVATALALALALSTTVLALSGRSLVSTLTELEVDADAGVLVADVSSLVCVVCVVSVARCSPGNTVSACVLPANASPTNKAPAATQNFPDLYIFFLNFCDSSCKIISPYSIHIPKALV